MQGEERWEGKEESHKLSNRLIPDTAEQKREMKKLL